MSRKPPVDGERGYVTEWTPYAKTRALLDAIDAVLAEYADNLPMTLRQVYYRLIGQGVIAKTENTYDSLERVLALARRAGLVAWDDISDPDADALRLPNRAVRDVAEFWPDVEASAKRWRRWKSEGQPHQVVVWTEAAGTVAQLERAIRDLPGVVLTGGGQPSVTVAKRLADLVLAEDVPTTLLHVGDYDVDGEIIYRAFVEDVDAFVEHDRDPSSPLLAQRFFPERLALTAEQVLDYDVITQPLKIPAGTGRAARARRTRVEAWSDAQPDDVKGQTAQLEALAPNDLAAIVRWEVEALTDSGQLERAREAGEAERRRLVEAVARARASLDENDDEDQED